MVLVFRCRPLLFGCSSVSFSAVLRRLNHMIAKITPPTSNAVPKIDPTTAPAIVPAVFPFFSVDCNCGFWVEMTVTVTGDPTALVLVWMTVTTVGSIIDVILADVVGESVVEGVEDESAGLVERVCTLDEYIIKGMDEKAEDELFHTEGV
jgi:hypothetical protein